MVPGNLEDPGGGEHRPPSAMLEKGHFFCRAVKYNLGVDV